MVIDNQDLRKEFKKNVKHREMSIYVESGINAGVEGGEENEKDRAEGDNSSEGVEGG